jgi:hypothetical protein
LAAGSTFRWKAGPGIIISTLEWVERPWLLAWTGKTLGIHATHIWGIVVQDGWTIVRTEESWEGWMARMFRRPMQRMLRSLLITGLGISRPKSNKEQINLISEGRGGIDRIVETNISIGQNHSLLKIYRVVLCFTETSLKL